MLRGSRLAEGAERSTPAVLGCPVEGLEADPQIAGLLRGRLDAVRRRKDDAEVHCTARRHGDRGRPARAREVIRPG